MLKDVEYVVAKLRWMRDERIWPNGLRYLWTDAFGLVLLASLHRHTGESRYLEEAEALVREVNRVLGRTRGIRIGEEADRDGQYFHYLAMWIYALTQLGRYEPKYKERAIELVNDVHGAFVAPGRGVVWKMAEDLSGPYPGYGFGALDAFHGYVVYRELDEAALASEIEDMKQILDRQYRTLLIDQDLGLGMMLWTCHFCPQEEWAREQLGRSLETLERLWVEREGYFGRQLGHRDMKFAFTNYGIAMGLQAVNEWPERVARLNLYFDNYHSGDEYERNAITHVMACTARFPGYFLRHFDE